MGPTKAKGRYKMKNIWSQVLIFMVLVFSPQFVFSQELIRGELETGGHRVAEIGERVVIDSGESEIEGASALSYIWSFVSKPEDSKALLFSVNESETSFVPDKRGVYVVRLYIYSAGFISERKDTITFVEPPEVRSMAVAGLDVSVLPGSLVDLSAEGSFHFGNEEDLNYEWVLELVPEGSSAQIYFPHNKQTSFYADVEGLYLARLTVFAENSQLSFPAYKIVRVEGAIANSPVANAGDDKAVLTGEDFTLSGSVSYTGSETLTYEWRIESAPLGSLASLENAQSLNPVFRTDTSGLYVLSFQAVAGDLKGAPDFIELSSYQKPIALALDSDIIALTDQQVALDGSSSFDPDGLSLKHSWTVLQKPQKSLAQVSDSLLPRADFSANKEGEYLLELSVKNSHFSSEPKRVKVRLISPSFFKAEAGSSQVVAAGSSLSLSASSSMGSHLGYFWSLIEKPELSQADLLDNRLFNPTMSFDKRGAYIFKLQVIKEGFLSEADYVALNAVLPMGTNVFKEEFKPQAQSLAFSISECEEITRQISISDTNKEYFIWFENEGVEEYFVLLNGKALTGRLNSSSDISVYPVSLEAMNSLSVRLRGLSENKLKIKILEKSAVQDLPTAPSLTDKFFIVSLGSSGSASVGGGAGLTYSVLEEPEYGTAVVSPSGLVTYTSNGTAAEKDFTVIKAVDSQGLVSLSKVDITIN